MSGSFSGLGGADVLFTPLIRVSYSTIRLTLPFYTHGLVNQATDCFAQTIETVGSKQF